MSESEAGKPFFTDTFTGAGDLSSHTPDNGEWLTYPPMTEARAREILGDAILPSGKLNSDRVTWVPGEERATLGDGYEPGPFTADELEAIAWWMRNKR